MVNVPAASWTTCPAGHASTAAWMVEVASPPGALTVRQTVVRAGIPPETPGFHVVMRSAGSRPEGGAGGGGGGGGAGGAVTVTVAAANSLLSATLVAMTWNVPALEGAVYVPAPLMVPPEDPSWMDQLTAFDCPLPSPVAEAEAGATDTVTFGAAVTVTVAWPLFELSATLVATTWKVPGDPGAVYRPEPSTLPPDAPSWTDQVTAVDWPESVPVTAAEKLV